MLLRKKPLNLRKQRSVATNGARHRVLAIKLYVVCGHVWVDLMIIFMANQKKKKKKKKAL